MKFIYKIIFILLLASDIIKVSAQEIKVTEFRSDPRDISARENTVYDANGDACAILKTRTGLQNLKFSSDLEIRKIENHEGEYWLWVSPNTHKIKIVAEGIDSLDYSLPKYTEEYNVYVIFLTAILPDKILYKSINSIRINTKPQNAEVYIDSTFMGYSPININTLSDTFRYEIQKKKHIPVNGYFAHSNLQRELFIPLKNINRIFFIPYIGGNKIGTPIFGFQTGRLGNTGWYISIVPPVRGEKCILLERVYSGLTVLEIDPENFLSLTGVSLNDHYIKLQTNHNTFFNHFRLKAGITQKILKNTFLQIGIGYAVSTRYYRMVVIPYSIDPKLEIPLNKTFYGKGESEIANLVLETGLIYNVSDSYLINLNISSIGKELSSFLPLELSFGIGYKF